MTAQTTPHLLYLAVGFPPAAKSSTFRLRETANVFADLGWDVTVLTLEERAWEREFGLDHTLSAGVSPRVRVVTMPLAREDLDPDIAGYSWLRARHPEGWRRWRRTRDTFAFPETVFGPWRRTVVRTALGVHGQRPVDLTLASVAPYAVLPAAWTLHRRHGVPFVIDYRDAWSLDVLTGVEAFPVRSRAGRWEQRLVSHAEELWYVNEPIRAFYRHRYPGVAERMRVVRNGYDPAPDPSGPAGSVRERDREAGRPLQFGYLGTMNFPAQQTANMLAGWQSAREREPLLAGARLTLRGHIGPGASRGATEHDTRITRFRDAGVSHGGPVAKADVPAVYRGWDVLVLALVGGRFVTSGKVYDYMSTGLPIVSVHEPDHAAADVLQGYPLHVQARSLEAEDVAEAFAAAARMAVSATPQQALACTAFAARYERRLQLVPPITQLHERLRPRGAGSDGAVGPGRVGGTVSS